MTCYCKKFNYFNIKECPNNCSTCLNIYNYTCSSCYTGYFLINGFCIKNKYFLENN